MDFNFDTGAIFGGIQTIDPTALPPLGGQAGVLSILGTGAVTLSNGTTLERPASPTPAMLRYNSDTTTLEYFNGVVWSMLSVGGGTVTSVDATSSTAALTVTGGPITSSGTFTFDLAPSLTALAVLGAAAGTGLVVQTGVNTFADVSIIGTAGNIVVTNGNGVAGNPTINLATVTQGATGNFVKVTLDGFGRVTGNTPVVTADITALVDNVYVNVAGDTMDSGANLTFQGGGEVLGLPTTPTSDDAAASKAYVDAVAAGLSWKQAVIVASTADIDLTTGGLLTIDGVTVADGDRVLVKDQALPAQNGIYIAHAGAWVRSTDMDSTTPINEVNGAAVFVEEGSTQASTGWTQVDNVTVIGTDPIQWVQFSGAGSYTAGNGLTLTGNQFSLSSPVSIANGGTNLTTTPTNGQLLIGNGTNYTLSTLTAGTGVSVTNGAGSITVANTGVVSIAGTANQITASAATGAVTLSTPTTFIAPGSVEVTTTLAVDVSEVINPNKTVGNIGVGLTIYGNTANDLQDWILNDGATVASKVDPNGDTYFYRGIGDSTNSLGTAGQLLTSNGSTVSWQDPAATGVTSFSAGTTGFTPNTATTGAVTLAGTLNVANGGTGLTSLGTANQVLGVNAAGTAAEYKTVSAGTGISVTNGANVITIANTGVTSVGLVDASTTPIYTVTNSPITTTGDLTITLASQNANTVFAAPGGLNGQPSFRSLVYADLPIQLYVETPVSPVPPINSANNSVAIGSGATVATDNAFAVGFGTNTNTPGQKAFANGEFATAGDAQHGIYVLRNITTDATPTNLYMDGTSQFIVMPNNSLFTFDIIIAGRRTDAIGGGAGYRFIGVIRKDTSAGSTTFVGSPSKTVLGETDVPWDAAVTLDTTNGTFNVVVTGQAAKTIRWVATVQTTEVTN